MPTKREHLEAAGRWLRSQREQRGYATAVDFARALDVDQSLVSRYERGISEVPDERASRIAELFDMDVIEVRRNLGLWVPGEREPDQAEEPPGPLDHELPEEFRKNPEKMARWRKVPRRKQRRVIREARRRAEQRRQQDQEDLVMLVDMAADETT